MRNFCLIFEYDNKGFMNIDKIIEFKNNLLEIEKHGKNIKLMFYGNATNEQLAAFMSYFNKLVGKKVCDISISLKTKELVIENGLNNKSIALSAQKAQDVTNGRFESIVNDYYNDSVELKTFSINGWERSILNVMGD